jgi:membrane-bound lytic murein transglycosylase D
VAHRVRRGESVWLLARRDYDVPVWLLRQYNPDLQLDRVQPGMSIQFPVLERLEGSADALQIADAEQ